jgi:hypothetical protein
MGIGKKRKWVVLLSDAIVNYKWKKGKVLAKLGRRGKGKHV